MTASPEFAALRYQLLEALAVR